MLKFLLSSICLNCLQLPLQCQVLLYLQALLHNIIYLSTLSDTSVSTSLDLHLSIQYTYLYSLKHFSFYISLHSQALSCLSTSISLHEIYGSLHSQALLSTSPSTLSSTSISTSLFIFSSTSTLYTPHQFSLFISQRPSIN